MFLMFILIMLLVVNLMRSLKYVFSLAMVMRNLASGFGMNKTEKSSEAEMSYSMNRLCTRTCQL